MILSIENIIKLLSERTLIEIVNSDKKYIQIRLDVIDYELRILAELSDDPVSSGNAILKTCEWREDAKHTLNSKYGGIRHARLKSNN